MDTKKDTYSSIAGESEGLFRDNGSKFIAKAFPVGSEEEVKAIVASLRTEYHDARHHCYAYRIGVSGELWRANDDGEPSGSAGRQILGQIDSAGLSDTLVVVIRYFGGILLGIPGLIRAYKTAAADALSKAETIEKTACDSYVVEFSYEQMPQVMKLAKDMDLAQTEREFGQSCSMVVKVRLSAVNVFLERCEKLNIFIRKK